MFYYASIIYLQARFLNMTIENSPEIYAFHEHHSIALGELYFFEQYVVAEFNEGVNIDFESFNEARILISKFYGNRSIGFIANRVHSYSIVLTEAPKFYKTFSNVIAYAIVNYSSLSEQIVEIENQLIKNQSLALDNRKQFRDLDAAITWVNQRLESVLS